MTKTKETDLDIPLIEKKDSNDINIDISKSNRNIEVHLRGINEGDYNTINSLRKKRRYTWNEFFKHLVVYHPLTFNLFNRESKPDLNSTKSMITVKQLLPMWCDNIAENMSDILKNPDISTLVCKTRDINQCYKITKIKDILVDKHKTYEYLEVAKEAEINPSMIEAVVNQCVSRKFVSIAGGISCNGCINEVRANMPALIIGGGPSLKKYNHLELLKKYEFNGDIFVVSRILKDALESGIIPKYFGSLDGEPFDTTFIDYDIIDKYSNEITALFGINIHHSTVERWKGKRHYFQGHISDSTVSNISHVLHLLTKTSSLSASGNIGSCMYNIASFLGYNPIVMIGMDLSFPTIKNMKEYYPDSTDEDWDEVKTIPTENNETKLEYKYKRGYNQDFKKTYYVEPVYESYKIAHLTWAKMLDNTGVKTINCTEQGSLHSKHITSMKFEDFLKNQDKIIADLNISKKVE